MNESRKLAEYLVRLRYEDLDLATIERAKQLILDQIGVQLAASTKPWCLAVYRYIRDFGGAPESTIVNYGDKTRVENAAFANATFGHGFELDDSYLPGNTRPGCVVVPSALVMGEKKFIDGKSLITAVVAGYEVTGRAARSIAPTCVDRGFQCTAISSVFGAAVVAARAMRFGTGEMLNTISIAGSHAAGLMEYSQSGGSVKRTHAGIVASGGVRSALLARAGITGPPTVMEGKKGFCRAFSNDPHPAELVPKPGDDFVVNKVAIKRHCVAYHIQAPIEATAFLVNKHNIKAKDIDEILMGTTSHALSMVGVIAEPTDLAGAQFSSQFSLALTVVKGGNGFHEYTEENLRDPEIRALAKRVRLEVDPEVEAAFPLKRAIRMTIRLKDGRKYEKWLAGALGTPENPMNWEQVREKFRSLATVVVPPQRAEKIIGIVENLESLGNVAALSRLMVA